ncbi:MULTISPECIES: mycothiol synthase [unclassified Corynebacterium]|uniref:mycothiol synthase n=1 Tax=unclassified Corynebacterium TaxID=2624378 RepID=UPI0026473BB6|nr:mycothiol synthase [Corynebacterium sp.]MDN5582501.1 mycothiol synthase [Corynebacterium sp.]MDN5719792.1 mycothiol synthase [Corynebacterium sp.]MDN6509351.1 mycothiol synthase [Corynebacterium sp.]
MSTNETDQTPDTGRVDPVHREFVPGQDAPLREGIDALLAAVEDADGVPAYSEAFLRSLDGTEGYRHLVAEVAGGDGGENTVVGVVSVNSSYVAELAVRPDVRRRGVATGMLREIARHIDVELQLSVWSHGDLESAKGFADGRGARTTRELLKMSVDCSGAERREALLAGRDEALATVGEEGLQVLDYTAAAEAFGAGHVDTEWLRVNNEAFAWHPEQGGWDQGALDEAREADWFDPAGVLFLFDGEECLGFHWTKRPDGDPHGEVYVVCLADAARGRGLGGPVTLVGVGYLIDGGAQAVDLYVEGDNAPAVATYRRLGFEVVHRDVVYRGMV